MENRSAKTEPKALPPASRTLGLRIIETDQEAGRVTAEFEARQEFCNPLGIIQGGFLVAMLDEVMAIAAFVHSRKTVLVPTLEIKVSFLNAARPGTLRGVGEVVRLSKSVAFLEGSLYDDRGELLARASARPSPSPIPAGRTANLPRQALIQRVCPACQAC